MIEVAPHRGGSLNDMQRLFGVTADGNMERRWAIADCMGISLAQTIKESEQRIHEADRKKEHPMTGEELTPWEQKEKLEELEEELRARGLPSPSDAEWDHGDKNRIVNPMSTPYPPPYDPGPPAKPDVDGDGDG